MRDKKRYLLTSVAVGTHLKVPDRPDYWRPLSPFFERSDVDGDLLLGETEFDIDASQSSEFVRLGPRCSLAYNPSSVNSRLQARSSRSRFRRIDLDSAKGWLIS